jgi:hypothetical protein
MPPSWLPKALIIADFLDALDPSVYVLVRNYCGCLYDSPSRAIVLIVPDRKILEILRAQSHRFFRSPPPASSVRIRVARQYDAAF